MDETKGFVMDWMKLTICLLICQATGIVGAKYTKPNLKPWYASLKKPSFTPPNWLFAPAWITLYFMMGVSAYLIWMNGLQRQEVLVALIIFGIQLLLNGLWSFVFFGKQAILGGLINIGLLWLSILVCLIVFIKISFWAGILLLPYLAWVSFASLLNYAIWRLNPHVS